jgi:hypothetical protein
LNSGAAETYGHKLCMRDDAVLPARNIRYLVVT